MNYKKIMIATICIPALSFAFNLKHVKIVKNFTGFAADATNEDYFDYNYPRLLANTETSDKADLLNKKYASDPHDTHLKLNLENIPLAIPFNKIYPSSTIRVIGYAAAGGWKNGWSGVAEYFRLKDVGVCHYRKQAINSMQILENAVKNDVNDKLTTVAIQGKKEKGYLYTVEWYEEDKADQLYEHSLECESNVHDTAISNKLISLAKDIDKKLD